MAKKYVGPVYLDPEPHIYIHRETGVQYTSVTKILHMVVPEFDEVGVAKAIEKQKDEDKSREIYIGMNQEQILEYWQYLNDTANEYGTYVHETIEEYLFNEKFWFPTDPLQQKVIAAYDSLGIDEGVEVWPERIMFSEEYELAGTADMVIDIDEVFFDVGDWKGLPVDTPILTNNGWKTMGTVMVGDEVYDMDGQRVKVLHTSTVKNVDCYEITFDNNEKIVADCEHRWLISFMRDKKFKDEVMTTEELFEYVEKLNSSGKKWSFKIPKVRMAQPLVNDDKSLPIDPYVLGVWLGDGHKVDNKITNMDDDIWCEIKRRGFELGNDVSGGGTGLAQTRTVFGLRSALNDLNLLGNKHIPDDYLLASYNQRLDLLRGFMDADGCYNKARKRFVMSTTQEWQRDAMVMLLGSLGIKSTVILVDKKFNGSIIKSFDICFSTDGLNPFLHKNKGIIEYTSINNKSFKNVVSVKKVESVPTRCIEVDSSSSTFLYGHSLSATHNTNKVFDFHNHYGFQTLKKPVDHLQDCHYSIYSLQLSIYALMYEMETGRKCRKIWIGYWDKETETMSKIPIMYLKHEAKKILDLHKYNTQLAA